MPLVTIVSNLAGSKDTASAFDNKNVVRSAAVAKNSQYFFQSCFHYFLLCHKIYEVMETTQTGSNFHNPIVTVFSRQN